MGRGGVECGCARQELLCDIVENQRGFKECHLSVGAVGDGSPTPA